MQRAASPSKSVPFTVPMPPTSPSAGVLAMRSCSSRRRRWAAMTSGPYSMKEPGVDEVGDVLASGATTDGAPACDGVGAGLVEPDAVAGDALGEIRPFAAAPASFVAAIAVCAPARRRRARGGRGDRPASRRPRCVAVSFAHPPCLRRNDVVVHLHRLDEQDGLAGPNEVSGRHLDRHDRALQRAADLRHRPALYGRRRTVLSRGSGWASCPWQPRDGRPDRMQRRQPGGASARAGSRARAADAPSSSSATRSPPAKGTLYGYEWDSASQDWVGGNIDARVAGALSRLPHLASTPTATSWPPTSGRRSTSTPARARRSTTGSRPPRPATARSTAQRSSATGTTKADLNADYDAASSAARSASRSAPTTCSSSRSSRTASRTRYEYYWDLEDLNGAWTTIPGSTIQTDFLDLPADARTELRDAA